VFLLLRRYARAHFPQDAVSAYGLALQLPVGPEAWGSQAQHHFVDCLLRLLHRALIHLYGAGGGTNVEYLHQTVQIARLTLDHFPLGRDNRIVFLMARSRVLQMWFQRTADVDSLCLSIALSRQLQVVAPTLNYPACRAHTLEYWNMGCSIAGPHVSIMDAVIALLRDLLQRCPLEHPLTSGLGDNLAQMMRMRCALPHESSLLDEMIAVNKQSLMGKSSTEPATIDSYMSLSLLVLGLVQKNSNYDPFPHAINLWEEALQGCPHDHHFRPALSHEAGSVFLARYERDGDVALLRRAVQLRRQAIACFTGDDNMRAQMCASLGDLLDRSFLREGSIADLHGRVEMYREVSRLRPDGHPNRAHACNELAGALRAVFLRFGTASALQEAIDLYEEALSLASVGSPLHARSCTNLAGALCDQGTDLSHLQRASNLLQEVLCLRSGSDEDSFTRASAQCNLATLMTTLDRASGSYASEERCIALYQEALDAVPGDRSIRSAAYIGLLQRIHDRVHRTGDLALLDTAICHGREAVSLSFPREANYHVTLNTLAQALLMRHNFVGQTADLDEAISLERTLFSELPQAPSTRISACCTLATSLGLEFDRTGDTNRIDEAVSLLQEAYNICPEGSSQRASVCANYASHLARWFRATSSIAWLDRAIELSRQSLHLYVERQALRPGALHSLGSYLATRFGAVGDVASLDEAIQLFREALDLHPGDAQRADLCCNLGGNLLKRVIRTKDPSHLEETISLLKEACSDGGSRKASRYTLGRVCLARAYLVPNTPSFDPPAAVMMLREATDSIYNTRSLVNILEEMRLMTLPASHDLLGVMSNIVSNLPRLSNATMSFQTRLQALRFTDSIGMDSLYCAVQLGDIQTGVELMENSRAVFWSQALNMRDPQLEYLPSNLRIEIERLLGDLSSTPALMDGSQLTSRDVLHQQNERLQSLIAEARTLPGLAHFMLGTPYKELASGFTNTTVVMLSADTGGTRAIIMRGASSQPIHLQLDELPVDELKDLSTLLADLGMRLGRTGISPGDDERVLGASRRRDGGSKMERLLSKLWRKVMKPVLHSLNFHTVCIIFHLCRGKV
jgi:tetratricopeptide (TPR) repeat protein